MGDLEELRGEGWRRVLAAARRRLRRTGGELAGSVALANPSEAERSVVGGRRGRRVSVPLAELDRMLRARYGSGLLRTLALLDRRGEAGTPSAAVTAALRSRYAEEGWFVAWLGELTRDGTVALLVERGDGELLGWAGAVLDRLPGRDLPLPVLAEWATGDPKALFGTRLAGLVLRALVLWQGAPWPVDRQRERRVWADAGVVADDLADQVLVLNLPDGDELPVRLTLHRLVERPPVPVAGEVFVCASAAVVRAAAVEGVAAPLVCTEGRPSVACHRLLGAVRGPLRWRADFDWPGLRTTAAAVDRYGAVPWRMGADDYLEALESVEAAPLPGAPAASPWDERLARVMAERGRSVPEERLIPRLLDDLR